MINRWLLKIIQPGIQALRELVRKVVSASLLMNTSHSHDEYSEVG
jgi:hypothetical protein